MVTDGNQNLGNALEQARQVSDSGVSIDVVPVRLSARDEVAVEKIVSRAVTNHALHCGVMEVEGWAAEWLDKSDRSREAAWAAWEAGVAAGVAWEAAREAARAAWAAWEAGVAAGVAARAAARAAGVARAARAAREAGYAGYAAWAAGVAEEHSLQIEDIKFSVKEKR